GDDLDGPQSSLLLQLAERSLARVLLRVDAALRHLPPGAGAFRLARSVGAAADPDQTLPVDDHDTEARPARPLEIIRHRTPPSSALAGASRPSATACPFEASSESSLNPNAVLRHRGPESVAGTGGGDTTAARRRRRGSANRRDRSSARRNGLFTPIV